MGLYPGAHAEKLSAKTPSFRLDALDQKVIESHGLRGYMRVPIRDDPVGSEGGRGDADDRDPRWPKPPARPLFEPARIALQRDKLKTLPVKGGELAASGIA